MPMPSKPCKYCKAMTHWSYQCFQNPNTKKRIVKKGRRGVAYDTWRDTIAIPYLDRVYGRVCAECRGERCGNQQLDVDHKRGRGAHPELKMTLSNVQYLGRYPCHYEKTIGK